MIFETTTYDLETNGFKGTSVLSFSLRNDIFDTDIKRGAKLEKLDRFYYRRENEKANLSALNVNGLYDSVIYSRRSNDKVNYPKIFDDDVDMLCSFFTSNIVGHNNIAFDDKFMPDYLFKDKRVLDTMILTTDICKIPNPKKNAKTYKYPKLSESANYFDIALSKDNLHTSNGDIYFTYEVLTAIFKSDVYKHIGCNAITAPKIITNGTDYESITDTKGSKIYYTQDNGVYKFAGFSKLSLFDKPFMSDNDTKIITNDFDYFMKNRDVEKVAYINDINLHFKNIPDTDKITLLLNETNLPFKYRRSIQYFNSVIANTLNNVKIIK